MDAQSLKKLREWFKKNSAELPWRPIDLDAPRDPYAVWISETMLQQTQVSTVRDYFTRWMKRFPDIETLAKASEEEVFKHWQGLGYYSRARNILKTAKALANSHRDCHAPCKGARNDISASEIYWDYAREIADSPQAYIHNAALMDLGRNICKVRNPG